MGSLAPPGCPWGPVRGEEEGVLVPGPAGQNPFPPESCVTSQRNEFKRVGLFAERQNLECAPCMTEITLPPPPNWVAVKHCRYFLRVRLACHPEMGQAGVTPWKVS